MKLFRFFGKDEASETEYKEKYFEIVDNRDKSSIPVKRNGITIGYIQYYESLNKWYYDPMNLDMCPVRSTLREKELRLIADKLSELNK